MNKFQKLNIFNILIFVHQKQVYVKLVVNMSKEEKNVNMKKKDFAKLFKFLNKKKMRSRKRNQSIKFMEITSDNYKKKTKIRVEVNRIWVQVLFKSFKIFKLNQH